MNSPAFDSIEKISQSLQSGQCGSVELTELMLQRIDQQQSINAFITVTAEQALAQAKKADQLLARDNGSAGVLCGVPVAVKDLFEWRGVKNTFGSLLFANHISTYNASVVESLLGAGAVILGKTNLHEFATGTTSINPHFGAVRNPWNTDCYAGGSSGGSAAAVAAGLCYAALGTDTGCSIRQPAHMCNLTGLKPTYGLVSKYGALDLSWSMDHAGPLTRTVADTAIMLQTISGHDPRDPASVNRPAVDYLADLKKPLTNCCIGIPDDYFLDHCQADIVQGFEHSLSLFKELGCQTVPITLPSMHAARAAGHTIIFAEFSALYGERAQQTPELFSDINGAFAQLGSLFSAKQLLQAQRVRRKITELTAIAMQSVDAIVMPTCPVTTAAIENLSGDEVRYHTQNTIPFDAISLPALSVPAGFDRNNLPFGLQIVGNAFTEARVLQIGHAFEQANPHYHRQPPL